MPEQKLLITITPTAEMVLVGDSMARVWAGRAASGLAVRVLVFAVAAPEGHDDAELKRELQHIPSPLAPGQRLT